MLDDDDELVLCDKGDVVNGLSASEAFMLLQSSSTISVVSRP